LPIQQLEAIQHGFIDAEKGAKSSEELSKKMADLREHKYSLMKTKQLLSSRIPTDSIDAQIKKIDEVLNAVNPKKDQQTKLLMSEALYARRRAPIPGATGFETSGVSRELLRDSYDRDIEEARNQGKINRMQTMIKEKEEVIKRGRRKWKRG
jgi:hypothetical protein